MVATVSAHQLGEFSKIPSDASECNLQVVHITEKTSLRMRRLCKLLAVLTTLGLLAHMDQMRMDPKHQFAAQYVLSRAANERREREALLAAAVNMSHFAMTSANLQPVLGGNGAGATGTHASTLSCSPTAEGVNSDPSTRISTPAEMKLEHSSNIRSLHEVIMSKWCSVI